MRTENHSTEHPSTSHHDDIIRACIEWLALATKAFSIHAPAALGDRKRRYYNAYVMQYMMQETALDVLNGLVSQLDGGVLDFIAKALLCLFPCSQCYFHHTILQHLILIPFS